jgi:hypothetical protein
VYFAGRLVQMRESGYDKVVVTDRLGSVVATGSDASFTRRLAPLYTTLTCRTHKRSHQPPHRLNP